MRIFITALGTAFVFTSFAAANAAVRPPCPRAVHVHEAGASSAAFRSTAHPASFSVGNSRVLAPAAEQGWKKSWLALFGAPVDFPGQNSSNSTTPAIAINIAR
ncbi:MAG TPA: hypothetical protein VGF88_14060 [Acidobacteriaceae bacterium]|jgi:hypothetical protein